MFGHRGLWMATVAVLGCLQAWDSGVLSAGAVVQALVIAAIGLPTLALGLASHDGARVLAVVAAFALLTIARVVSPVSLNALHLIAFVPGVIVLAHRLAPAREPAPPPSC